MKKLIFVRHGRAEDQGEEISDFERSLTTKGKVISKLMAQKLKEKVKAPGIYISSPAFRALETAYIFGMEYRIAPEEIIVDSDLYYKMNYKYLVKILSNVSDKIDSIILFGHNPAFSEIANSLCSEGCDIMPKCAIAGISFNATKWSEIKHKTGKLEYFLKPDKVL
jgi:phosphohistidine phosphatase